MITDIFQKRYPRFFHFSEARVPGGIYVFLRQSVQILFADLNSAVPDMNSVCLTAYSKLVRELGYGLYNGDNVTDVCINALSEHYDLWNNDHELPELFISARFSLLELLLAEIEKILYEPNDPSKALNVFKKRKPSSTVDQQKGQDLFRCAVHELNIRFREARLPLQYHNGLFQYSSDNITASKIHEPFWNLLKDTKWMNVDIDIKEAIDRRDNNERDAVLYALKALESTIKIISDEKGWTRGNERGAAHYIDNLVSSANGRFIDPWEAEYLKALFRDLRNPHGHGPGSATQPTLSYHQQNWVIESSMIWIKSLANRI